MRKYLLAVGIIGILIAVVAGIVLWNNFHPSVPRGNIIGKPVLIYWSYRASTEDLMGESAGSLINHFVDLGEHFFTRTRWERTFQMVRGFPDAELPHQALPMNRGVPNP